MKRKILSAFLTVIVLFFCSFTVSAEVYTYTRGSSADGLEDTTAVYDASLNLVEIYGNDTCPNWMLYEARFVYDVLCDIQQLVPRDMYLAVYVIFKGMGYTLSECRERLMQISEEFDI